MKAPRDTSAIAHEVQLAVFRGLEPSARLALAYQMSEEAYALTMAGMRHRHPAWPSDRVVSATRDLMVGEAVAHRPRSRPSPHGQ